MSENIDERSLPLGVLLRGASQDLYRIANALEDKVPKYRSCEDCGVFFAREKGAGECRRHYGNVHLMSNPRGCAESIPKEGSDD